MARPAHQTRSAARRPPSALGRHRPRRRQGYSVAELLIGMVISLVVLGVAVRLLVSLIQGDSAEQVELNRKDEMNRVLGLLQDETLNAQRVESGSALTPPTGCTTSAQLILRGASSSEDIAYSLRTQTANSTWRGPAVLVRCGPAYATSGALDTAAGRSEQVVLDSLTLSGFTASALGGSGTINRNVALTLITTVSGTSISSSLQVPVANNQVYAMASSGISSCPNGTGSMSTGCADPNGEAMHYRPVMGASSITGTPNMEDIFYFDLNRSAYTLSRTQGSGTCTNDQCTVSLGTGASSITLFDADVLVFKDMQIRL